jgi:hypothetical protein
MPVVVPLQAVPSQTVSVALNNQACQINVYVLGSAPYEHLYVDLLVADTQIIGGIIAQNFSIVGITFGAQTTYVASGLIVRNTYLGFVGDIAFLDTQGQDDPVYTGLGSRFILVYFYPSDLPAGVA